MRWLLCAAALALSVAACDPSPQASAAPPAAPAPPAMGEPPADAPAAADEPVTTATIFVGDV